VSLGETGLGLDLVDLWNEGRSNVENVGGSIFLTVGTRPVSDIAHFRNYWMASE
jgi:hypothetical protein